MYRVVSISYDMFEDVEPIGSKEKNWLHHPEFGHCMFKKSRLTTGEEWAERIACAVAELLGLPHAHYELALCASDRGVITPNFIPPGGRLVLGNELLGRWVRGYGEPGQRRLVSRQHTLARVMATLERHRPALTCPPGWSGIGHAEWTAEGVFVGYLLLDALIGNQDRHHANWGFVYLPEEGDLYLAPTFDHASSLGFGETDQNRRERLTTRDRGRSMEQFVLRAKTRFYPSSESATPLETVAAFLRCGTADVFAVNVWLDQLSSIRMEDFRKVIDDVPDSVMSDVSKDFAFRMIELNRKRLLDLKFLFR